ncbi:MAG: pyrimidine 5'-nucleotidase [Aliifodinibius sp.]|nr:pyrimidine 5'-nucleotidase [Fodinibius sp.]
MSITTMFIDLDGTLYPNDNGMWDAIASRMELFMRDFLNLPNEKIPSLREEYYRTYGTTLRGLIENYSFDKYEYLKFVHDIPLEKYLKPDIQLRTVLNTIPIKKWIFTNSDRAHSERVLGILGIQDLFEEIIDVTAMSFRNKPDPLVYQTAINLAGDPMPYECIFIEDSAKNLIPARDIGMRTVLIGKNSNGDVAEKTIPDIYSIKKLLKHANGSVNL